MLLGMTKVKAKKQAKTTVVEVDLETRRRIHIYRAKRGLTIPKAIAEKFSDVSLS